MRPLGLTDGKKWPKMPKFACFLIFFFEKKILSQNKKRAFLIRLKKMIHVNFWIYIIVGLVTPLDGSSSSSQPEVKIRVHPSFLWAHFARRREKKKDTPRASRSAGWVSNYIIKMDLSPFLGYPFLAQLAKIDIF